MHYNKIDIKWPKLARVINPPPPILIKIFIRHRSFDLALNFLNFSSKILQPLQLDLPVICFNIWKHIPRDFPIQDSRCELHRPIESHLVWFVISLYFFKLHYCKKAKELSPYHAKNMLVTVWIIKLIINRVFFPQVFPFHPYCWDLNLWVKNQHQI